MEILKAAIIGLGNIGFLFNLDPRRKDSWSHVTAYEKAEGIKLTGAVETDDDKTRIFKERHDGIPVYKSVAELMGELSVDIVSICTPAETHYALLKELAAYPLKAVFCEKPLTLTVDEAKEVAGMYRDKNIILAVNHVRRWESSYLSVREMIDKGKIGEVRAVNALYSAQIFNIGTHLFDAVRMLIRKDPLLAGGILSGCKGPDPDLSGWLEFSDHVVCTLNATGKREDLVFEIDIVGTEGRLRVTENGEKVECFLFQESPRYSGYRELVPLKTGEIKKNDRFVEAVSDIVKTVNGKNASVNCTGEDGFYALAMSHAVFESAKRGGEPVKVQRPFEDIKERDVRTSAL